MQREETGVDFWKLLKLNKNAGQKFLCRPKYIEKHRLNIIQYFTIILYFRSFNYFRRTLLYFCVYFCVKGAFYGKLLTRTQGWNKSYLKDDKELMLPYIYLLMLSFQIWKTIPGTKFLRFFLQLDSQINDLKSLNGCNMS